MKTKPSSTAARRARPGAAILGGGAAAALLLCASSAHAFDPEWELGGYVGAHFFNSMSGLGRDQFGPNPQPDVYIPGLTFQSTALQHSVLFGLRLGIGLHPRLMLEAELGMMPTRTAGERMLQNGTTQAHSNVGVLGYRGNALFHILTGRLRPFLLFGVGGMTSMSSNAYAVQPDTDFELHGGVGLKYDVGEHWGLRLDGRVLGVFGPNQDPVFVPDGEVTLGIYGFFGGGRGKKPLPPGAIDTDGDGVADTDDRCPTQAGPAENGGCPDQDSDNDGIIDRLDKCPDRAGVADNGGCPDQDSDGDGIVDRLDKCPDKAGVPANQGCPEKDSDGDGVLDKDDKCPDQAGPKENNGCPDTDKDGDGVVDRLDKCIDQPETKNGYQDEDGCPDEVPKAVQKFTGVIQGINFETGKANILPGSFPTLDKAVKVLKDYPDVKLEISGHTDNVGTAEMNKKLSQERADAVKKYFEGKGIAEGRLVAKGFGPEKPLADNGKPEGRAKNRRVEFQLQTGK